MSEKFKFAIDRYDANLIFNGLMSLRNEMIRDEKDTSYVDELILRIADEKKACLRAAEKKGLDSYEAR